MDIGKTRLGKEGANMRWGSPKREIGFMTVCIVNSKKEFRMHCLIPTKEFQFRRIKVQIEYSEFDGGIIKKKIDYREQL